MTICASSEVEELDSSVERQSKVPRGNEPNSYLFVGGNPINRVDPLGLQQTMPGDNVFDQIDDPTMPANLQHRFAYADTVDNFLLGIGNTVPESLTLPSKVEQAMAWAGKYSRDGHEYGGVVTVDKSTYDRDKGALLPGVNPVFRVWGLQIGQQDRTPVLMSVPGSGYEPIGIFHSHTNAHNGGSGATLFSPELGADWGQFLTSSSGKNVRFSALINCGGTQMWLIVRTPKFNPKPSELTYKRDYPSPIPAGYDWSAWQKQVEASLAQDAQSQGVAVYKWEGKAEDSGRVFKRIG
jgi:hypothetical protein